MNSNHIDKMIEETINSFDGASKATPQPFLLTRVLARLNSEQETKNWWGRAVAFMSRPVVALTAALLIIALNTTIIIRNSKNNNLSANVGSTKDEYAINVISIYDTENQEP